MARGRPPARASRAGSPALPGREPVEPRHERTAAGVFGQVGYAKADPGPARRLQRDRAGRPRTAAALLRDGAGPPSYPRPPPRADAPRSPAREPRRRPGDPAGARPAAPGAWPGIGAATKDRPCRTRPTARSRAPPASSVSREPGRTDTQADCSSANGAAATRSCTTTRSGRAHAAAAEGEEDTTASRCNPGPRRGWRALNDTMTCGLWDRRNRLPPSKDRTDPVSHVPGGSNSISAGTTTCSHMSVAPRLPSPRVQADRVQDPTDPGGEM